MRLRTPRDDDFAAIAAITNHYIATTAANFEAPRSELFLRDPAADVPERLDRS